ncbi:MAG: RNA methyltransferase [Bacteroidales bacterium]|nr:RNA methyltransferase [Bacteroidales bacterium]
MDLEVKRALKNYLFEVLTDNKRDLFEKNIENRTRHLTVVLEDIFQPHNASAVLRSADLFGVQDVHIIENKNQYNINPDVVVGSNKWINLYQYNQLENNTLDCIKSLREKGYIIAATTPYNKDINLEEMPVHHKTAFLFGTELTGLSEIALQHSDVFVKIPMYGFTESFNISVSAALTMYSFSQRMRRNNILWQLTEEEKIDIQIQWAKNTIKEVELIINRFMDTL